LRCRVTAVEAQKAPAIGPREAVDRRYNHVLLCRAASVSSQIETNVLDDHRQTVNRRDGEGQVIA
jgi:hypothetical protein